jgi:membrane protein implicated in regulation of membrane protease activity
MLATSTLGWILFGSMAFLIASALLGGHHDMGGGDVDGSTHHGVTTSELFNLRNLALLAVGFSGCSIIARNVGVGEFETNLAGVAGAVAMFLVGVYFFRMIRKQEGNSITSNIDLIGKTAVVTVGIPSNGYGEISLQNTLGAATSLTAKTVGIAIAQGSEVRITAVSGNTATVNLAS